jgi:hypothetical protein
MAISQRLNKYKLNGIQIARQFPFTISSYLSISIAAWPPIPSTRVLHSLISDVPLRFPHIHALIVRHRFAVAAWYDNRSQSKPPSPLAKTGSCHSIATKNFTRSATDMRANKYYFLLK